MNGKNMRNRLIASMFSFKYSWFQNFETYDPMIDSQVFSMINAVVSFLYKFFSSMSSPWLYKPSEFFYILLNINLSRGSSLPVWPA